MDKKREWTEKLVYVSIWAALLITPVLHSNLEDGGNTIPLFNAWIRLLPFFLVFLINNSILLPHFLLRGKWGIYLLLAAGSVLAIASLNTLLHPWIHQWLTPPPPLDPGRFPHPRPPHALLFLGQCLLSLLVIGFNTAIKVTRKWMDDAQEHLETKMTFLRQQISPHFFMNTLNNIHALVDLDPENAKESCIRLGRMMRYLLYDSESGRTRLSKEVEFMQSYVELMRLRFTENVKIELNIPASLRDVDIPALLFIPLLENAFKHGIHPRGESFIHIHLEQTPKSIRFTVHNSSYPAIGDSPEKHSGLGLANVRHRLHLLFGKEELLTVLPNSQTFTVILELPL
jgi:hypothetical protein